MKSIEEIKATILAEKAKHKELAELNSTSKVAIYNLWIYITSVVMWAHYQLWEVFKKETTDKLAAQKLYTLTWFRKMALDFRYGHTLDAEKGTHSDTGYTAEQITKSKIISQAAVIEVEVSKRKYLYIKVAKKVSDKLASLLEVERSALETYYNLIKPAGTKIVIFTATADKLRLTVDFYYDPLILDKTGSRIDGSDTTPVQKALRTHLQTLEFNGGLNLAKLSIALSVVPGCADKEVYIRKAEANYKTPVAWTSITSTYIANSGYMEIADTDLTLNFIAKK